MFWLISYPCLWLMEYILLRVSCSSKLQWPIPSQHFNHPFPGQCMLFVSSRTALSLKIWTSTNVMGIFVFFLLLYPQFLKQYLAHSKGLIKTYLIHKLQLSIFQSQYIWFFENREPMFLDSSQFFYLVWS